MTTHHLPERLCYFPPADGHLARACREVQSSGDKGRQGPEGGSEQQGNRGMSHGRNVAAAGAQCARPRASREERQGGAEGRRGGEGQAPSRFALRPAASGLAGLFQEVPQVAGRHGHPTLPRKHDLHSFPSPSWPGESALPLSCRESAPGVGDGPAAVASASPARSRAGHAPNPPRMTR